MDLDSLLDVATAAGALRSGQSVDDVLHRLDGDGSALALAAQHLAPDEYTERENARPWTKEEDAFLDEALGQLSIDEIASYLGRSPTAVKVRWTRKGFAAPSKQPDEITGNQIADALGIDEHSVVKLIDQGILPGRHLPTEGRTIRVMKKVTFYRWAVNPMNWPYFENSVFEETRRNSRGASKGTHRIGDPHLRRLIERQKKRWTDEWWSTKQVAEHFGVNDHSVNKRANAGVYRSAIKWGNWRILRSEAVQVDIRPGSGSNMLDHWSPDADAWLVLATAVGLAPREVCAVMGPAWSDHRRVDYRLRWLFDSDEIGQICMTMNDAIDEGFVCWDDERRLLWTDWRYWSHRFPGVRRAVYRFRNDWKAITFLDKQYLRGVMTTWMRWHSDPNDTDIQDAIDSLKYCHSAAPERFHDYYVQMKGWGLDPFGEDY